jgi:hypothetical protein
LNESKDMSRARTDAIKLKQLTSGAYTWENAQTFIRVKEKIVRENAIGTYTVDLTKGIIFNLTMTGNTAFVFPPVEDGAQFTLNLKQDATGGRAASWPLLTRWGNDIPPTLSSLGLRTDTIAFVCEGNVWMGYEGGKKYNTTLGPTTWTFTYSSLWPSTTAPTQAGMSDETATTYWGNANTEANAFLRADFGAPCALSYIKFLAAPASASWGPTYTNGADLQYSLDGTNWTTITTISGASETVMSTYILPNVVMARYVRLFKASSSYLAVGDLSFG